MDSVLSSDVCGRIRHYERQLILYELQTILRPLNDFVEQRTPGRRRPFRQLTATSVENVYLARGGMGLHGFLNNWLRMRVPTDYRTTRWVVEVTAQIIEHMERYPRI